MQLSLPQRDIFCFLESLISPQNISEQAPSAFKDGYGDRFSIAFLNKDLFAVFTGYLKLRICLSSFRWNASSLASSVCVRAHVSQLYVRIDFTSALCLIFSPPIHMFLSCFLRSTSSSPPWSDPTFFVSLQFFWSRDNLGEICECRYLNAWCWMSKYTNLFQ